MRTASNNLYLRWFRTVSSTFQDLDFDVHYKSDCRIFHAFKSHRPNHLLKVTCKKKYFPLFYLPHIFRIQSPRKWCLRFAIFTFSEKLQNIFEIGLNK